MGTGASRRPSGPAHNRSGSGSPTTPPTDRRRDMLPVQRPRQACWELHSTRLCSSLVPSNQAKLLPPTPTFPSAFYEAGIYLRTRDLEPTSKHRQTTTSGAEIRIENNSLRMIGNTGVLNHKNVDNPTRAPEVDPPARATPTHRIFAGQNYADNAFLVHIKRTFERKLAELGPSVIAKICKSYIDYSNDPRLQEKLTPQTTDVLFQVMEERGDLTSSDVIFLQVLLWRVGQLELFHHIVGEVVEWKDRYSEHIACLMSASLTEVEEITFSLLVDKKRFGPMDKEQTRRDIAKLLRIREEQVFVRNDMTVEAKAAGVVSEMLYREFDRPDTRQSLASLGVTGVTFSRGITDRQTEETKEIPKTSDPSLETGSDEEESCSNSPTPGQLSTQQRWLGEEDLEKFDLYYGRCGKFYVFPDEPSGKVSVTKTHSHPTEDSSAKADTKSRRKRKNAGATTEQDEGEVEKVVSTTADTDAHKEQKEEAKAVVIKRIKAVLEQIKSPSDPPVFLFHNQHLGETRKTEIDLLVLHPTLGILVLEVETSANIKSFPTLHDSTTRLLQAQEVIQEEMGDLLGKDAVVMTVALPAFQQEDADVIRHNNKKKRLEDHPEFRLVCGTAMEAYTEWVGQLEQHRAMASHAFKGATARTRLENFKRACFRRCSIADLCSGKSFKDSADLQPRVLLTQEQLHVRDSQAELLHISGPAGSGKTMLLVESARRWVDQGRRVALAVKWDVYALLLGLLARSVCGKKTDLTRVSTHRDYYKLLQWLDTVSTADPAFVIVDLAQPLLPSYSNLRDHVTAGHVLGLWTADNTSLDREDEAKLRTLGGTVFHLQGCFRCLHDVTALANAVRPTFEPPLLPPPVPAVQELGVGVKLICHPDHPQSQSRDACSKCKEEAKVILSSLGLLGDKVKSDLTYSDCVVLTTHRSYDRQRVADWLRALGVPAVAENDPSWNCSPVLLPGVTAKSSNQADLEAWMSRVSKGTDREGNPAMHVMWYENFQGLQRRVVLLWHEDREDKDRHRQGQEERDLRLLHHRSNWLDAVTRCQEHLAVVVATPSPLLSLLQTSSSAASTQH